MPLGRRPTAIGSPIKTGLGGKGGIVLPDSKVVNIFGKDGGAFDPAIKSSTVNLSNNNLTAISTITSGTNSYQSVFAPFLTTANIIGKIYFEFYIETAFTNGVVGFTSSPPSMTVNNVAFGAGGNYSMGYYPQGTFLRNNGIFFQGLPTYGPGDYIGFSFTSTTFNIYKNGVNIAGNISLTNITPSNVIYPGVTFYGNQGYTDRVTLNTGSTPFKYLPSDAIGLGTPTYDVTTKVTDQFKTLTRGVSDFAEVKPTISDVFSIDLINLNAGQQRIINNKNLLYKGGAVFERTLNIGSLLYFSNTIRGIQRNTRNDTNLESSESALGNNSIYAYNVDGFNTGSFGTRDNKSVAYTFINNPYFFNVIQWNGNGNNIGQTLPHGLKVDLGFIFFKPVNLTNYSWFVWHRATPTTRYTLNTTDAGQTPAYLSSVTSDSFTTSGLTFTATNVGNGLFNGYAFGHDESPTGLIQCKSFTTDVNGNASVTHGWAEGAQFVMFRRSDSLGNWFLFDTERNALFAGDDPYILMQDTSLETYLTGFGISNVNGVLNITGTGVNAGNFICVLIRAGAVKPSIPIQSFTQTNQVTGSNLASATPTNMSSGNASITSATGAGTPTFIRANLSQSTYVDCVTIGSPFYGFNVGALNNHFLEGSNDGGTSWFLINTILGCVNSPSATSLYTSTFPVKQNCTNIRIRSNNNTIAISQFTLR